MDKVTKSYTFLRLGMVYNRQSLFSCKVYLQNKLDLSLKGRNIACHKSICINWSRFFFFDTRIWASLYPIKIFLRMSQNHIIWHRCLLLRRNQLVLKKKKNWVARKVKKTSQFLWFLKEKYLADIIFKNVSVLLIYFLALEILNLKKATGLYANRNQILFTFQISQEVIFRSYLKKLSISDATRSLGIAGQFFQ